MILFSANENRKTIDLDMVQRVIRVLDWQKKVREECDVNDAEGQVAKLEESIRKNLRKGPQAKRELQQRVHYNRYGIFIWNSAISNLQKEEMDFDHKRGVFVLKPGF